MPAMETRLLIGGELVAGDGPALAVEDPFKEEQVAEVGTPDAAQLAAAIEAALRAQREWAGTPAAERAEALHEVAARLRARTDELAELMTREGGKPLVENRDEVGWTASAFDFYAELARSADGRVIPPIESSQLALVLKEPLGLVTCIVPWNYPLLLLAWKLAPVLAAGNAALCKPSELTPLSTLALAPCVEHLPAGLVTLLAGGGDVGERLVDDERVDGIAFTGSVATGTRIAERAARCSTGPAWPSPPPIRSKAASARTSSSRVRDSSSTTRWATSTGSPARPPRPGISGRRRTSSPRESGCSAR